MCLESYFECTYVMLMQFYFSFSLFIKITGQMFGVCNIPLKQMNHFI